MKTLWKWIIGILIVLLVVGALAAAFFVWRNHPALAFGPRLGERFNPPNSQDLPNAPTNPNMPRNFGYGHGPMDGDRGWRPPMFGQRGFGFLPFFPFFGGFFLFGGLVKLVIFGLLLYGAYWLGRRNARLVVDPKPAAPAPAPAGGRRVAKK